MHKIKYLLPFLALLSACTAPNGQKVTFFSLMKVNEPGMDGPSSLPPPGYDSEFWVDSKGCSFIRTGGDTTQWVPQVNIQRKPVCDPNLAIDAQAMAAPAPLPAQNATATTQPLVGTVIDPNTGLKTEILPPRIIPESYVQVGAFAEQANGLATRERFAVMGFPIVGGGVTPPPGVAMNVVLGPFTVESALGDALATARGMGFADAFTFRN